MGIVITHFIEEGMLLKLMKVYNVLGLPDQICSSVADYSFFLACQCMWHRKVDSSRKGSKMRSLKNKILCHLYK